MGRTRKRVPTGVRAGLRRAKRFQLRGGGGAAALPPCPPWLTRAPEHNRIEADAERDENRLIRVRLLRTRSRIVLQCRLRRGAEQHRHLLRAAASEGRSIRNPESAMPRRGPVLPPCQSGSHRAPPIEASDPTEA